MAYSLCGSLLEKLNKDRLGEKLYCDIIIVTDNMKFHCHRFLLGSVSGYFQGLFRNRFKDSRKHELVIYYPAVYDIHSSAIELVYTYIYTERIDLTDGNIWPVLLTSEYLDIKQLKLVCFEYLKSVLSKKTWLGIYSNTKLLNISNISQYCMKAFISIWSDFKFDSLSDIAFTELKEFLKDYQQYKQPYHSFSLIQFWISYKRSERLQYLVTLLNYVDFKFMGSHYIRNVVLKEKLINDHQDILKVIKGILSNGTQRNSQNPMLLLLGGSQNHRKERTMKYGTKIRESISCCDPVCSCDASAIAFNDNKIYVAGGRKSLSCIQIYNIDADSWHVNPCKLQNPRRHATASVVNGRWLCVAGGENASGAMVTKIEVFEIDDTGSVSPTDEKLLTGSASSARFCHAAVSPPQSNQLFLIGGAVRNGNIVLPLYSCQMINIETKMMSTLASLNTARCAPAAVIYHDSIIVLGGCNDQAQIVPSVESFSLAAPWIWVTWTQQFPAMAHPRWLHCACVVDGRLFVIGGRTVDNTVDSSVEVYDPATEMWTLNYDIDIPKGLCGAVSV